ncbi:hypothetical protein ABIA32_001365 [Streptacidiphilus sp. MAP12-20]|uniref:hypothetical protein n=1 Tax=Streptacidiphilus sp. MAP12-20 TaxID=3156299 RepID=UPI003511334A
MINQAGPDTTTRAPVTAAVAKSSGGRLARVRAIAAVLVGSLVVAAQGARMRAWIVDDAAVTFAYARSLAHGLGPVQQAGSAPVEGYSNPSWLVLLTLGHELGLFDRGSIGGVPDLVWYPKLLALFCVVGILCCVRAATRSAAATLLAALVLAANWSFVAWSCSGLENPLYGLLAVALATLLVRAAEENRLARPRTAVLAGLLALLAALTRPDGVVYLAAYPAALLLRQRRDAPGQTLRPALLSLGVFGAPYGGFLLWRRITFGQWLPNTAVAKAQGTPGLDALERVGGLLQYAGWAAVLLVAVAAGRVAARPGPARRGLAAAALPLGLALLGFAVLRPDWMALYRFATPVWTLGTLFGAMALTRAFAELDRTAARALLAVATALALAASAATQSASAAAFRAAPTLSMCKVADRYGRLFNTYAQRLGLRAEGTSVLLPDLGGTLLTTRLRVVDLAGLTDPTIARAYAAGDMTRLRAYVLDEVRPTFVHVHGPWSRGPGLSPGRLRAAGYLPVYASAVRAGDGAFDGDWIRGDAVTSPTALTALRAWAATAVPAIEARWRAHPLSDCELGGGDPGGGLR